MSLRITTTIALFLIILHIHAQDSSRIHLPSKYLDNVSSKTNYLEQQLDDKTDKVLSQMMKREEKMKRKLMKIDSLKAKEIFGNVEEKYKNLKQRLASKLSGKKYITSLDTLSTSLKFLQQNPRLVSQIKGSEEKLKEAMGKVNGLEDKFQKAE